MEGICRICMVVTNDLISLSKTTAEGIDEVLKCGEMFEQCFGIKLNEIPEYQQICMNCKIQLTYFNDFKLEALRTHDKLLKLRSIYEFPDGSEESIKAETKTAIKEGSNFDDELLDVEYLEDEWNEYDNLVEEATGSEISYEDAIEEEFLEQEENIIQCEIVTEDDAFECMEDESSSDDKHQHFKMIANDTYTLNTRTLKKKPLKKTNSSKWKYHCEPCGKNFRNEETFKAHVNVHNGLPPYKCDICNKGFKFRINFDYHMKNHNNHRSFKCTCCEKSFICKWDLKIHMRVHENLRPYICDICGKQFRVRSHMTDHLETHNEENAYQCPFCEQKYKTRATFKVHVASIHVKKRQYFCEICNKAFNRKHHLKVHIKVHEKQNKAE